MAEQKHYDLYLSRDWDGKVGVITVIPPPDMYALHIAGNALRTNPVLYETDEARWRTGAAEGQRRFFKEGVGRETLALASELVGRLLVGQGHGVTMHPEIGITDSGFFDPNA